MSDTINDGGPAFPAQELNPDGKPYFLNQGATLRDYFAAKAMQGAFTPPIPPTRDEKDYIALHAYAMADAMLKARAQ